MTRTLLLLALLGTSAFAQSDYLPLSEGSRWTLRSNATDKPIVIEVTGRSGDAYLVRFSSPFGANDWRLEARGDKYYMTGFGANGQLMDLPEDTLYFDFGAAPGARWSNTIGRMRVIASEGGRVMIAQESKGGKMVFGFERGRGFVQFGEGGSAFMLQEGGPSGGASSARGETGEEERPGQTGLNRKPVRLPQEATTNR